MSWRPFWQRKTLAEMSPDEWDALCDGCGKCCLHKLEDEDSGEVFYTDVACRYLDESTCRCKDYANRSALVDTCLTLDKNNVDHFQWLPITCAYRLLSEGERLADWHPLVSGSYQSVHKAGMSVRHRVWSEQEIAPQAMEDHIIRWVI